MASVGSLSASEGSERPRSRRRKPRRLKIVTSDDVRARIERRYAREEQQLQRVMVARIANAYSKFAERRNQRRGVAALVFQRRWRGWLTRHALVRSFAARTIQHHARLFLLRLKLQHAAIRQASAVRIQQTFITRQQRRCRVLQRLARAAAVAAVARFKRRAEADYHEKCRRVALDERLKKEAFWRALAQQEKEQLEWACAVISGHLRERVMRRRLREGADRQRRAKLAAQISETSLIYDSVLPPPLPTKRWIDGSDGSSGGISRLAQPAARLGSAPARLGSAPARLSRVAQPVTARMEWVENCPVLEHHGNSGSGGGGCAQRQRRRQRIRSAPASHRRHRDGGGDQSPAWDFSTAAVDAVVTSGRNNRWRPQSAAAAAVRGHGVIPAGDDHLSLYAPIRRRGSSGRKRAKRSSIAAATEKVSASGGCSGDRIHLRGVHGVGDRGGLDHRPPGGRWGGERRRVPASLRAIFSSDIEY